MYLNNKLRTIALVFIFLVSLISTNFIVEEQVNAQPEIPDGADLLNIVKIMGAFYDFEDPSHPTPFRYIGSWESNKTMTIEGEMSLDIYLSSIVLSSIRLFNYQDTVNISVYHKTQGKIEKVDNGQAEFDYEPESLSERVQKKTVKLSNINLSVNKSDKLLFSIEITPSDKPIEGFVEKNYDRVIKWIRRINTRLNQSENEKYRYLSENISLILDILDQIENEEELLGNLANVLRSAAFYYGSENHQSSVKFSNNESEDFTLYFQDSYPIYIAGEGNSEIIYGKINNTEPTGETEFSYPPVSVVYNQDISLDFNDTNVSDQDQVAIESWIMMWLAYSLDYLDGGDVSKTIYYLHDEGSMDSSYPEDTSVSRKKLSNDTGLWVGPKIVRNKIIRNISADLYLHYPKLLALSKPVVKAEILDGEKVIASEEKQLDRTTIMSFIRRGPAIPTTFNFDEFKGNYEIFYDHEISLAVSISKSPLFTLRSTKLLYDSQDYPSSISLSMNETDNIKLDELESKEIYAGGVADFNLVIDSKYNDNASLNVGYKVLKGSDRWNIEDYPEKISLSKDDPKELTIKINSTATDSTVYSDEIKVYFNITGKTGIDKETSTVKISKNAVVYDIGAVLPEDREIKHGQTKTFEFKVRNLNKGYYEDSYYIKVISEHDKFKVNYSDYEKIPVDDGKLDVYDKTDENPSESIVKINVTAPWYTDIKTNNLKLIVYSYASESEEFNEEFNVTIDVITPGAFESIYHMFESAGRLLGFDDIFEKYTGWVMISIFLTIIIIIALAAVIIIKKKYVELICFDRIREIEPSEEAEFEITVKNPVNKNMTYEIILDNNEESKRWDISLDKNILTMNPRQTQIINLNVKPTNYARAGDWKEVKIIAKPAHKSKSEKISTITTLKKGKEKLEIRGVVHWPKVFKKGDRVETSFKLRNNGNVSAENISVFLYVNDELKNKVEKITIPRNGYADVEIPWIAEKGKNEIYIVVK